MAMPGTVDELRAFIIVTMAQHAPPEPPMPTPGIAETREIVARAEGAVAVLQQREHVMVENERQAREAQDRTTSLLEAFNQRCEEMAQKVQDAEQNLTTELLRQDEATESMIAALEHQLLAQQTANGETLRTAMREAKKELIALRGRVEGVEIGYDATTAADVTTTTTTTTAVPGRVQHRHVSGQVDWATRSRESTPPVPSRRWGGRVQLRRRRGPSHGYASRDLRRFT